MRLTIEIIGGTEMPPGIPGLHYPVRSGNKVTLFQDAHHDEGDLPEIKCGDGSSYVHGQCWEDVLEAINNAKSFIYICGE